MFREQDLRSLPSVTKECHEYIESNKLIQFLRCLSQKNCIDSDVLFNEISSGFKRYYDDSFFLRMLSFFDRNPLFSPPLTSFEDSTGAGLVLINSDLFTLTIVVCDPLKISKHKENSEHARRSVSFRGYKEWYKILKTKNSTLNLFSIGEKDWQIKEVQPFDGEEFIVDTSMTSLIYNTVPDLLIFFQCTSKLDVSDATLEYDYDSRELIRRVSNSHNESTASMMLEYLACIFSGNEVESLYDNFLKEASPKLRWSFFEYSVNYGKPYARELLKKYVSDPDQRIRSAAEKTLKAVV